MLIAVCNEKGGVGKTTLAVNLAAIAAGEGQDVLLVDADRQTSASGWAAIRHEAGIAPAVTCVAKVGKVGRDLVRLQEKFDTIIVDTGGRDSEEMRQAMAVADRIVIPIKPAEFDVWSLARMAMLLRDIEQLTGEGAWARTAINGASSNPMVKEADDARASLAEYADVFPLLNTVVIERVAVRKAAREGLAVTELPGALADLKAAAELRALFAEVTAP